MTTKKTYARKAAEGGTDNEKGYLGADGTVSHQGREGGRLPRDVGTRDELKRSEERPGGATRVRKSDEEEGEK
ncbi:hypothetical protein [Chachezhania antarctica]|uniref:hypothetical protein n=1 Tax=Chachezhania antarctica TaxID=2340860 RepID=UPI000EABA56C|nr:hypothetical protein [Chachezhania antarctica]|tara:strand:- start:826 stop:1044 length:219 start_codon:yes stop_codon:yes gene_type:complete